MLDQRVVAFEADDETARCAQTRHAEQVAVGRAARVGTRDQRPTRPIPVLHQRLIDRAVEVAPGRETARRAQTRHAEEVAAHRANRIRTGHNRPARPVPVLHQRRLRTGVTDRETAHRARARNPKEDRLGRAARIGAGNDRPARPIPPFHERLRGRARRLEADGVAARSCRTRHIVQERCG